MKNLFILTMVLSAILACCPEKNCNYNENTQCPKECQNYGRKNKMGKCRQNAQCPKQNCMGCPGECPQNKECPNKMNCPQKGACQQNQVKFVEENCPANPVSVKEYSNGLQHIGLPTAEVQKTIDFYTGLGFTLATRHDINGRDFAFMQLGNLLIEVIPNDNPTMRTGAVDHICLNVNNIEELFEKIKKAGYKMIDQNIVDIAFWKKGARYFFIEGPNKERIEFCEIVK